MERAMEAGISEEDFWSFSWAQLEREFLRQDWLRSRADQRARAIYSILYNVNARKGARKSPRALWPIPLVDGLFTDQVRAITQADVKKKLKAWGPALEAVQKRRTKKKK